MADIQLSQEVLQLRLYETRAIVPLETRGPNTYFQRLHTEGNSFLSSVFVQSLDVGASVLVEYFDTTTGQDVGETHFLGSHSAVSTALGDDRALITRMHNKPYVKATVTGGDVRFGVYVSVVSSFASDLDAALKKHGDLVNLALDKGLVAMYYDSIQGKFFFLPGENGAIKVTGAVTSDPAGEAKQLASTDGTMTTPGSSQDLITSTVPGGKTWYLRNSVAVCRGHGSFDIMVAGVRKGTGKTNPATPTVTFKPEPFIKALAGEEVKLVFTQVPSTISHEVDAFIHYTEV